MNAQPNPYLKTRVLSASPEELRLMLYDGAIKFARLGLAALGEQDFEQSYEKLTRAQKIVLELSSSLDHRVMPELTDRLAALYTYIYKLLVEATIQREPAPLNEAIELLGYERETWAMLMQKLTDEQAGLHADGAGAGGTPPPAAVA